MTVLNSGREASTEAVSGHARQCSSSRRQPAYSWTSDHAPAVTTREEYGLNGPALWPAAAVELSGTDRASLRPTSACSSARMAGKAASSARAAGSPAASQKARRQRDVSKWSSGRCRLSSHTPRPTAAAVASAAAAGRPAAWRAMAW
eukprot:scaffold9118_cov112-Isochrysis_galbana.AAC.2